MINSVYPYLILFVLNFIEGSVITLGAGVSLDTTGLNYSAALSVLIVADIVSDIVYYSVGRFTGHVFESKHMKVFGVNEHRLGLVREYYAKHGIITLFFAKMSDVLAMPAVILAGVIKMRFATFLAVSVITSIIKALALFTAGYLLSSSIGGQGILNIVHLMSGICILIVTILMFRYFYVRIKDDGTKNNK